MMVIDKMYQKKLNAAKIMKLFKSFGRILFWGPRNASKGPPIEGRIRVINKMCKKKLNASKIIKFIIIFEEYYSRDRGMPPMVLLSRAEYWKLMECVKRN